MGNEEKKPKNAILEKIKALDVRLTYKFALAANENSRLGFLRPHFKLLELSCHGILWLAGCTIMLWLTTGRDSKAFICNLYIALVLDIICVAVVKALTRRRRPSINKKDMPLTLLVDKLSFPSGHVTRSVLVTSIFYHQFGLSVIPSFLLHVWCIGVSASRVLLGRHHIGDVLGGIVIGWCTYLFMSIIWLNTDTAIGLLRIFMSTEASDDSG